MNVRTELSGKATEPREQNRSLDAGFAQVIVLGGIAAVAALVAVALPLAQSTGVTAAALERLLLADVLTRSAFDRVLAAIESRPDTFEQQTLGGQAALTLSGETITVSLEGEAGKIDVLAAPPVLLTRLATNLGLEAGALATFNAELEAARAQRDGARALEAARRWLTPRLADFDAAVTRFGNERIDPTYAPLEVLQAIPDLSPAEIAQILSASPAERGQFAAMSDHLAANSRRFSVAVHIDWAPEEVSVRRLPIELSSSGRAIVLAGPY